MIKPLPLKMAGVFILEITLSAGSYGDAFDSIKEAYGIDEFTVNRLLKEWVADAAIHDDKNLLCGVFGALNGRDYIFDRVKVWHRSGYFGVQDFKQYGVLNSVDGAKVLMGRLRDVLHDFDESAAFARLIRRLGSEREFGGGPHAFFSYEVAISASMSGLNYRIPEFLGDYIKEVDNDGSLMSFVRDNFHPCVVCCSVTPDSKERYMEFLWKYLSCIRFGLDVADILENYTYNGRGEAIPPSDVVSVLDLSL